MRINAFIIEDEARARKTFINLLEQNFPQIHILGSAASVRESVTWLEQNAVDVVFMDVELSDGTAFDILSRITVRPMIVMTTAYYNYAVKAFEVNSVDYLLKPVDVEDLRRAVGRIEDRLRANEKTDIERLADALRNELGAPGSAAGLSSLYRQKFILHLNNLIVPVQVSEIAYFYAETKSSYIVTKAGARHPLDESLDSIESELDPRAFFRISRSCIMAASSISSVSKLLGGRLSVTLPGNLTPFTDLTVSRARVQSFLEWFEK